VGSPDAVLLKAGRLTVAEYEVMKQHAVIGDRIPLLAQIIGIVDVYDGRPTATRASRWHERARCDSGKDLVSGDDPNLVHRLKNHLAIIMGFADLVVMESAEGDPHRADLVEIQKAARDALAMMADIDKRLKSAAREHGD
jgi:hypothetical protein